MKRVEAIRMADWQEMTATSGSPAQLAVAVAARFAALPAVRAVALGGSAASGAADATSDLDLYVYAPAPLLLAERAAIARALGRPAQVGYTFWEPGDEWPATADQPAVDLMYRTPAWIEAQLERTLVRFEASKDCSTCLWHNVRASIPLFDRDGWYARLQTVAAQPYPEGLRRAIVAKNSSILRQTAFSYLHQLRAAVRRADAVSVQHRSAALLASYFDILFAGNWVPHPGEKCVVERARLLCDRLPVAFEERVADLLRGAGAVPPGPGVIDAADALVDGLDDLLVALQLAPRRTPPAGVQQAPT